MQQITLTERPGVCRWCGCTERDPCEGGCGWANRAATLCTTCADIDRDVRTGRGRAKLIDRLRTAEHAAHQLRLDRYAEVVAAKRNGRR